MSADSICAILPNFRLRYSSIVPQFRLALKWDGKLLRRKKADVLHPYDDGEKLCKLLVGVLAQNLSQWWCVDREERTIAHGDWVANSRVIIEMEFLLSIGNEQNQRHESNWLSYPSYKITNGMQLTEQWKFCKSAKNDLDGIKLLLTHAPLKGWAKKAPLRQILPRFPL